MKKILPFIRDHRLLRVPAHFINTHRKLSLVILISLIAIGIFLWPKPPPPLETETVTKNTIQETVSATGTVDSETTVNLNFSTAGRLATLNVRKGDVVKKGQTIATLDLRSTQKSLENALKDYSLQRNTFEQTKEDRGVRDVVNAPNDNLRRIMESNQYNLDKAVLSVELQELAKQSSILTSPIEGIVTRADVSVPGVNVSPTTVFTILDPESLMFKVDVDESDIGEVHLGQSVEVTFDAYPDEKVYVNVSSIDFASHTTSTGANAYTVEAQLPVNSGDRFRIGMSGDAEIVLNQRKNVLTIPLSSLVDDEYVYIQTAKSFEKRKVILGIQNDTETEIKSGLKENDKVALSPTEVEKRLNIKRPQETAL